MPYRMVTNPDTGIVEIWESVENPTSTQKPSVHAGSEGDVEMLKMLKGVPSRQVSASDYLASIHEPYPAKLLPEVIRESVDALQSVVQCPYEIAVQSVLCAISASFASMTDARGLHGRVPLTLAMLASALSGDRKSTADNEANKGIDAAVRQLNASRGPEDQIIVFTGNTTVEALAIQYGVSPIQMIRAADAATFFYSHSMGKDKVDGTVATLADAWSGFRLTQTRAGGNRNVETPRLGFSLMTQEPYFLDFIMNQRFRQQGLTARTLYHVTKTLQGQRLIDPEAYKNGAWRTHNDTLSSFHSRTEQAMREGLEAFARGDERRVIDLSSGALDLLLDLNNQWELELADRPELQGDQWVSRRVEHTNRLAGNFDLYMGNHEITQDTLYLAAQLTDHYFQTYLRIIDFGSTSEVERKADRFYEWLVGKPNMRTVRKVVQGRTYGKADEVRPLLRELSNQGKVEIKGREDVAFTDFKLTGE